MNSKAPTPETTQKVATTIYMRFKVTVCLYRSPNNSARSLSTPMAVNVNKDTIPN